MTLSSTAKHILGGNLVMSYSNGREGRYDFTLVVFVEESFINAGDLDQSATLKIQRRRDGRTMDYFSTRLTGKIPLVYKNQACAQLRSLKTSQMTYEGSYQFDPREYDDPQGYLLIWERCCRNEATTNIQGNTVGMTFYLEMPPMRQGGAFYVNSSPRFAPPNGEYVCVNKPFRMSMSATDPDGDALRYSLVTPLRGYASAAEPYGNVDAKQSFPLVDWASGFSATTAIPGSPPLTINAQTGELTVTATQPGLYLFCVLVEEFRNGVKIGAVRRDFQLPVVDCPREQPPVGVVRSEGEPVTATGLCEGSTVTLTTDSAPDWAFQWQKDGVNLPGATGPSLAVQQPGQYTLIKTFNRQCAAEAASQPVQVLAVRVPPVKISQSPAYLCQGDSVQLSVPDSAGFRYRWYRDGQLLSNERQPRLVVQRGGNYVVDVSAGGGRCARRDTSSLTAQSAPPITLVAPPDACREDTLRLQAITQIPGSYRYEWWWAGQKQAETREAQYVSVRKGAYQVRLFDERGCRSQSTAMQVAEKPTPLVDFDSLATRCGPDAPDLTLLGRPAGGSFTGRGVNGVLFSPKIVGVGRHPVSYRVRGDNGCWGTRQRLVVVEEPIQLSLPASFRTNRGDSVRLVNRVNRSDLQFEWTPPVGLSSVTEQQPMAGPAEPQTYRLKVFSEGGCEVSDTTRVFLVDRLFLPNAFSPNGDGINETWEIFNIQAYPDADVSVFNRWGEIVFWSRGYIQPWDGTLHGQRVPAGVYAYQVRTADHIYRGQLTIIY